MKTAIEFSKRWIADQAMTLIHSRGQNVHLDGAPGYVREVAWGGFTILYTTPFTGAETLPGWRAYRIDIWHGRKKVFCCAYDSLDELTAKGRSRQAWVQALKDVVAADDSLF